MKTIWKAASAAAALCFGTVTAHASVVVEGTRVVYPQSEHEVTVKLTNIGEKPSLVQAWIDDGHANEQPDDAKVPFLLTPPVFRLDPHKGQSLRLIYTQDPLPQDRESLYWLNVLDVPPMPSASETSQNTLQLAFRTRIKLFFRPKGLNGSPDDAPAKLTWKFVPKTGGGYVLEATNPTPYHVSFSHIEVESGTSHWVDDRGEMVDPISTAKFDVGSIGKQPAAPFEVDYSFINDYGGNVNGQYAPKAR